jgi:hypothetical protein
VAGKRRKPRPSDDAGWKGWLAKLKDYKAEHGDCLVNTKGGTKLGRWVSNQRTYKKKLDNGEPSQGMTAAKLEALGFAWHPPAHGGVVNEAGCEAQLAKLKDYKAEHGDCMVPRSWAEDPELGY